MTALLDGQGFRIRTQRRKGIKLYFNLPLSWPGHINFYEQIKVKMNPELCIKEL
jgi:hypothetical protein